VSIRFNKNIKMITDTTKISLINSTAIGISMSEIELTLRIISLIAAIVYTIYKFYKEYKNEQL